MYRLFFESVYLSFDVNTQSGKLGHTFVRLTSIHVSLFKCFVVQVTLSKCLLFIVVFSRL